MLKQSNFSICNIDMMSWKTFVKESHDIPNELPEEIEYRLGFKGREARKAYEEILNQESNPIFLTEELKNCKQKRFVIQKDMAVKAIISNDKTKKYQYPEDQVSINAILKAIEQKDLQFLLKHVTQENVNLTDDFGWTPLMSAAYCGHLDIIEFLLSLGPNKEARGKSGLTAAQLALKKNYLTIVALLKKKTECSGSQMSKTMQTNNPRTILDTSSHAKLDLIEQSLTNCNNTMLDVRDNINCQLEENSGFYCDICNANH